MAVSRAPKMRFGTHAAISDWNLPLTSVINISNQNVQTSAFTLEDNAQQFTHFLVRSFFFPLTWKNYLDKESNTRLTFEQCSNTTTIPFQIFQLDSDKMMKQTTSSSDTEWNVFLLGPCVFASQSSLLIRLLAHKCMMRNRWILNCFCASGMWDAWFPAKNKGGSVPNTFGISRSGAPWQWDAVRNGDVEKAFLTALDPSICWWELISHWLNIKIVNHSMSPRH